MPEYALVIAKGGPKLEKADGPYSTSQGPRMIKARKVSVATLASMLISAVEAPVVDQTGLTGEYNFALEFAPLLGPSRENETLPNIFAAVQELGLKLEAIKGPVEMVVIDRAEMPTEN